MISSSTLEQARQAALGRFSVRDETLRSELDALCRAAEAAGSDDGRLGVKLRLVCEEDLIDRGRLAWSALRRACEETGVRRSPGLMGDLLQALDGLMHHASLSLAQELRARSEALSPAFAGRSGITAEWIAGLRARAMERQAQAVENFVKRLPGGPLLRRGG